MLGNRRILSRLGRSLHPASRLSRLAPAKSASSPPADCGAARGSFGRGTRSVAVFWCLRAGGRAAGRAGRHHAWRYAAQLLQRYPRARFVPDVLYVDDGRVLTAAGSAAGLDLCLHLVRRDWGVEVANQVARRLVLPAHRQGGQAQYVESPIPRERAGGDRLAPLLDRVRANLDQEWPVGEAAISIRALHRWFREAIGQSPGVWLAAELVARARELLESCSLSIKGIAAACGFGSAATLRHHFRAVLGTSPAAYRRRFTLSG
jgi:AraC family transcriptional activator FtrA